VMEARVLGVSRDVLTVNAILSTNRLNRLLRGQTVEFDYPETMELMKQLMTFSTDLVLWWSSPSITGEAPLQE
jgi:hypothetical protein